MKSIAVTMTYYNRSKLFFRTLETIKKQGYPDYRVIVVDDASTEDPLTVNDPAVDLITVRPQDKTWKMTVAFNMAIVHALKHYNPDIVIVQNAECYHIGDVLRYADEHVVDGTCVTYACWNDHNRHPDTFKAIADDTDHTYGSGWYNHPINPRYYNFCNAYTRRDMLLLNGMDERYKDGTGSADNNLVRRTHSLGVRFHVTDETKPFVVHQHHSRSHQKPESIRTHNDRIHYYIRTQEKDNYRARHTVTENFDEIEYLSDT